VTTIFEEGWFDDKKENPSQERRFGKKTTGI